MLAFSVLILALAIWGTVLAIRRVSRKQPFGVSGWGVVVFWCLVGLSVFSGPRKLLNQTADQQAASDASRDQIKKTMEAGVAAKHGGELPKTMSPDDLKIAMAVGAKAADQQGKSSAAEKLKSMKTRPDPADVKYSPDVVQMAVKQQLRDPDSATFGPMSLYSDRKMNDYYTPVVCGTINSKNDFGGYSGNKAFVFLIPLTAVMIEGSPNQQQAQLFVKTYNQLCAGAHD
ncbi:hypothetical protein SAMN05444169_3869 [Bradyrhizobium erythrophlei]|uniref:Uncharacterized protein n=2 Tax=Bradyrhizobium erythrophlei TaxID=1437360 RepID=A0A1M5M7P3_9BRAD|nr:hypothetical protein SAMN05444169_3869 [Bradyrhizobium erythrophlei]